MASSMLLLANSFGEKLKNKVYKSDDNAKNPIADVGLNVLGKKLIKK